MMPVKGATSSRSELLGQGCSSCMRPESWGASSEDCRGPGMALPVAAAPVALGVAIAGESAPFMGCKGMRRACA